MLIQGAVVFVWFAASQENLAVLITLVAAAWFAANIPTRVGPLRRFALHPALNLAATAALNQGAAQHHSHGALMESAQAREFVLLVQPSHNPAATAAL